MNVFLLVRFLHIISAIWFICGIVARQIVRAAAKKSGDVQRFASMNEAAGRIEAIMVIPGNLAVIIFGVILGLQLGSPILGFLQGSPQNWLLVSNILLIVGLVCVPLVFIPRGKIFDVALKDALAKGQFTPALNASINDPVVRAVHIFEFVAFFLIVFLMVFKPF